MSRDYPTQEELDTISKWDVTDLDGWFDYIASLWHWEHLFRSKRPREKGQVRFEAHTGGWSGNEDIIVAMMQNHIAWSLSFYNLRRGGHFEFRYLRMNADKNKLREQKKAEIYTIEDIRRHGPCYDPSQYIPEDWTGTVVDILRFYGVPELDRIWVVTRPGFLDKKVLKKISVWCFRKTVELMGRPDYIPVIDAYEKEPEPENKYDYFIGLFQASKYGPIPIVYIMTLEPDKSAYLSARYLINDTVLTRQERKELARQVIDYILSLIEVE